MSYTSSRNRQRCYSLYLPIISFMIGVLLFIPTQAIAMNGGSSTAWESSKSLLYRHLGHLHWIANYNGPKILYDFIDPNSRDSHRLFNQLQPLLRRNHVTVRQLIVGYLTPTSAGKAAAILQSANPQSVLNNGEALYKRHTGAAIIPISANPMTQYILHKNFQVLAVIEGNPWMRLAPLLIYKNQQGRVHVFQGTITPTRLQNIIAQIKN